MRIPSLGNAEVDPASWILASSITSDGLLKSALKVERAKKAVEAATGIKSDGVTEVKTKSVTQSKVANTK